MRNFLGGDFTFQKIYIFLEFFLFFLRGGGDGRPKNGGMEMDDPKKLMCFARKYPCVPYFCFFFGIFLGGGGTFSFICGAKYDQGVSNHRGNMLV